MAVIANTKSGVPSTSAAPVRASSTSSGRSAAESAALDNTYTYLPLVMRTTPVAKKGGVVHVHASGAHAWNYSAENYWDFVSQSVVDSMVDTGIKSLTGQTTVANAWHSLIPNYQAGQTVAIKVSFNNTTSASGSTGQIDGIIEPVNAIIRGLHSMGIPYTSIVVFDSSRYLPTRFTGGCDYTGVVFRYNAHSPWGAGSAPVTFTPPGHATFPQQLSKEVVIANYLINVPILKYHGMAGLSLGLKNHYGTVHDPGELHDWSSLASPYFVTTYSPIVDINKNTHIASKTILTVGDAIFAAFHNYGQASFPAKWSTFSNQSPKSLFFSENPVAIDCVMGDLLDAEWNAKGRGSINVKAFTHLALAEAAGLGTYERGNPWTNSYTKIDYTKIEI